jgi:2,3-bisphosphoglycerate-dependent phosphoglycerate mutase
MEDVSRQHRAAPGPNGCRPVRSSGSPAGADVDPGAGRRPPPAPAGGWRGALRVALAVSALAGAAPAARAETTVFVVRHAEKVDASTDAELDGAGRERARLLRDMLRDLSIETIYASKYRRTQQTVAPVAESRDLAVTIHETAAIDSLAGALRDAARDSVDRYVLVSGHSNTVIAWLEALGIAEVTELLDHEYDNLFVVTLGDNRKSRLLRLRFGY